MIVTIFMLLVSGASSSPDYLCNYAKIVSHGRSISVHARHADRSEVLARLTAGTDLFICDEYRNDDHTDHWLYVAFADSRRKCVGSTQGLSARLANRCRRGWVRERHVETLSG